MSQLHRHSDGRFCWNQIATSSIDQAIVFYSALFGWEVVEEDLALGDEMVRLKLDGDFVVGIHQVGELGQPHWEPHIAIEDIDAFLDVVKENGGDVSEEPQLLEPYGSMAEVVDPNGTKICLWSAGDFGGHSSSTKTNVPRWYTLHLPQIDRTDDEPVAPNTTFWPELLRWSAVGQTDDVQIFGSADGSAFVAITIPSDFPPAYPGWVTFVEVEDVQRTCQSATAINGKVISEPQQIAGMGECAILADPQGAVFGVIKPS